MGILYGRRDLLEELEAYKVRPANDAVPFRFETGTPNYESIAGLLGTIEYLEDVGNRFGENPGAAPADDPTGRKLKLRRAAAAIRIHEKNLTVAMAETLRPIPGISLYGITDPARFDERVATFSCRLANVGPRRISEELDKDGIYSWDGHYYALEVIRRLDVEDKGGMLRVGAVHYNTLEEIERLGKSLARIAKL